MATRAGTPCCNRVAVVCRASCSRASRTPANASSAFHDFQSEPGSIGRPLTWAKRSPFVAGKTGDNAGKDHGRRSKIQSLARCT